MKTIDVMIDLERVGVDYCDLLITFLREQLVIVDQKTINNIKTNVFNDVMAQICSILDMSEVNGEIRDFYDKVNDIPDFKVLGYYEFLIEPEVNKFFCSITKQLAYNVFSIVNRYVDLTSLSVRTSLSHTTTTTLLLTVEKNENDSYIDVIL